MNRNRPQQQPKSYPEIMMQYTAVKSTADIKSTLAAAIRTLPADQQKLAAQAMLTLLVSSRDETAQKLICNILANFITDGTWQPVQQQVIDF